MRGGSPESETGPCLQKLEKEMKKSSRIGRNFAEIRCDCLGFLGISWDFLGFLDALGPVSRFLDALGASAAAREPLGDGKHRRRCVEVSAAHAEVSVPHSGCCSWLATTGVSCACTAVQKKAGRFDACVAGLGAPRARGRPGGGRSLAGAGSGWGLAAPLLPCVPGGSFSEQYPSTGAEGYYAVASERQRSTKVERLAGAATQACTGAPRQDEQDVLIRIFCTPSS